MKFSLISIDKMKGKRIWGNWIQNCITDTLDEAEDKARSLLAHNSGNFGIAIIDEVPNTNPSLDYFYDKELISMVSKCENVLQYNDSNCSDLYNCCDCGGNDCGCGYCFSCNACESCLEED